MNTPDRTPTPRPEQMEGLNEQQTEAATFAGRNLLVLAGAGTGKTRTIIARAKYLLDSGVLPTRLLVLSFTRKSAREIVARLESSVSADSSRIKGQTFHSWCMELIERNPDVFNFGRFTVIDEDDRESAFKLVCGRHFKSANYITHAQLAEVYSYVVNARCNLSTALSRRLFNGRMDENTREQILKKLPAYQEAIRKYLAFKAERRYLDYDDILQKVAVGLKKNPHAADFIASGYDHILIDEMQDTNPLQYLLLESFWGRCSLFCVGDDAQSIYGFRGADFRSIHNFTDYVPDASVLRLTRNYRSTQEILDLSNWLLDKSPLNYDKRLVAARGRGAKPVFCHYRDEWDQARDIVMRIKDSQGEEGCRYRDNMVLSRSNRALKPVEACLIEAQIPYVVYGGTGLMESAHIRDVVAALRIVANPRDELAWMRYLELFPKIGPITAAKKVDAILGAGSFDECVAMLRADAVLDPAVADTLAEIKNLEAEVNKAVAAAFSKLNNILRHKYKDDWDRRSRDAALLEKIGEAADSIATFISDYVLDPMLETGVKNGSRPEDYVVLTTIHSAKGLEARNCYIINVNYSQYPSARAVDMGEDAVEEDRRCLYVALTRAKDKLVVYRSVKAVQVLAAMSDTEADDLGRHYFFNGMPAALADFENIGPAGASRWSAYRGAGISLADGDEFDFS